MFNKAIVMGRLTADPELRKTENGVDVTTFTLAVDRAYSRNGECEVDFFQIVAWKSAAEFVCRYFSKGQPMLVEGEMRSRKYTDKNGIDHRIWEIVAQQVRFTGKNQNSGIENNAQNDENTDDFTEVVDDGDLPF